MSIKVPNREHWMAPVRRDDTIAFLRERVMQFGVLLLAFMGYGHWLVVRANLLHPAILDQKWFISGVVFFLVATIIWIRVLMAHFRNPD